MPKNDDHDDLTALDFSVADDGSGEQSGADTLHEYAPAEPEDTGTELDAVHWQTEETEEEDEHNALQLFTVTNPPETVSVSALIDGRTHQVELSPKVTSMSESELADEILVLADLARQKGLAGQHTYLLGNDLLLEGMRDWGFDGSAVLRDFMENGLGMPTPEQAEAAQAEVFATRYARDDD